MHQRHEEENYSSNDWGHTGKVEGHMVVPKTVAEEAWNSQEGKVKFSFVPLLKGALPSSRGHHNTNLENFGL